MKPITAIVKEKGGAKTYPVNQEVTLNADGSGGPILKIGLQGLGAKGNKGYEVGSEDSPVQKKDACYRKAKDKYDVFPSAYASGYIARCRKKKGNIK